MDHHLIHGAAAITLVVAGGFFVVASWRSYVGRTGAGIAPASMTFGRAELAPLVGVPLAGLVLILVLIALANAGGGQHHEGHRAHGTAPIAGARLTPVDHRI